MHKGRAMGTQEGEDGPVTVQPETGPVPTSRVRNTQGLPGYQELERQTISPNPRREPGLADTLL